MEHLGIHEKVFVVISIKGSHSRVLPQRVTSPAQHFWCFIDSRLERIYTRSWETN